jgi:hypothetical protein
MAHNVPAVADGAGHQVNKKQNASAGPGVQLRVMRRAIPRPTPIFQTLCPELLIHQGCHRNIRYK